MNRSALLRRKRPAKYRSERTWSDIHQRWFQSASECARADQLALLERAGHISELKLQPQVCLSDAQIGYKPDFSFIEDGRLVFVEVKGFETQEWLLKQKLWSVYGPSELRVERMEGQRCRTLRVIHPRNERAALIRQFLRAGEIDEAIAVLNGEHPAI